MNNRVINSEGGWGAFPNHKKDEGSYIIEAVITKFQNDLREILTRESKQIIDEAIKRITCELNLSGKHYTSADDFSKRIVITVNDLRKNLDK